MDRLKKAIAEAQLQEMLWHIGDTVEVDDENSSMHGMHGLVLGLGVMRPGRQGGIS